MSSRAHDELASVVRPNRTTARRGADTATLSTPTADHLRLLSLQRHAGNRAVSRLVAAGTGGRPWGPRRPTSTAVQRAGGDNPNEIGPFKGQSQPTTPSICADASLGEGDRIGSHAAVYLATRDGEGLQYWKIDLALSYGADDQPDGGIEIRINPFKLWGREGKSRTWPIDSAAANAALAAARDFSSRQGEFRYNKIGLGYKRYNCALFVERILRAAGIEASAGLIVSTPKQVATGRMF